MSDEQFEQWAIVELFGHQRIAGLVSEFEIGGAAFVRVDVPRVNGREAFTKLYGQKAIYAITFTDRDVALAAAEKMAVVPVDAYSVASVTTEAVRRRLEHAKLEDAEEEPPYEDDLF